MRDEALPALGVRTTDDCDLGDAGRRGEHPLGLLRGHEDAGALHLQIGATDVNERCVLVLDHEVARRKPAVAGVIDRQPGGIEIGVVPVALEKVGRRHDEFTDVPPRNVLAIAVEDAVAPTIQDRPDGHGTMLVTPYLRRHEPETGNGTGLAGRQRVDEPTTGIEMADRSGEVAPPERFATERDPSQTAERPASIQTGEERPGN